MCSTGRGRVHGWLGHTPWSLAGSSYWLHCASGTFLQLVLPHLMSSLVVLTGIYSRLRLCLLLSADDLDSCFTKKAETQACLLISNLPQSVSESFLPSCCRESASLLVHSLHQMYLCLHLSSHTLHTSFPSTYRQLHVSRSRLLFLPPSFVPSPEDTILL